MARKKAAETVQEEVAEETLDESAEESAEAMLNELKPKKADAADAEESSGLKARAKKLAEGISSEGLKLDDFKLKDIGISKDRQKELLVPLEDYVKSGIHLGTKVISGDMRQFVYRRRADGLAILNTNLIDAKLRTTMKVIEGYPPKDIIFVCKREAGWSAAKKFSEATGIRVYTKKYPAGIMTNPNLEEFFEPSLVMIADPWLDKNALSDSTNVRVPVVGFCDTNNILAGIAHIIPCNNKSSKSIGIVLYIIAKHYCAAHKIPFTATIKDFVGEEW